MDIILVCANLQEFDLIALPNLSIDLPYASDTARLYLAGNIR